MSGITVIFVQPDGVERRIEGAELGRSLMEIAREHHVTGIEADCGGACACATCHVYVDPQWRSLVGSPNELEDGMLDLEERKAESRLSCQIKLSAELDGIRVVVAS